MRESERERERGRERERERETPRFKVRFDTNKSCLAVYSAAAAAAAAALLFSPAAAAFSRPFSQLAFLQGVAVRMRRKKIMFRSRKREEERLNWGHNDAEQIHQGSVYAMLKHVFFHENMGNR